MALPATKVVNPGLKLPIFPFDAGGEAATRRSSPVRARAMPWPEGRRSRSAEGVETATCSGLVFPAPAGRHAGGSRGGRLTLADGTVKGTFQLPVTGVTAAGGLVTTEDPARPALGTLEVALAAREAGGGAATDLELADLRRKAPHLPISAGEIVEQRSSSPNPHIFGGYHLILRPGDYAHTEDLNYFASSSDRGRRDDRQAGGCGSSSADGKALSTAPMRAIDLGRRLAYMFGAHRSRRSRLGDYEL
jgi:hypothetical protein